MFIGTKIILGNIKLYETYGIMVVGFSEKTSPFGVTQSIYEEKTPYSLKPLFQRVDREPLSFTLTFAREGEWDDDMRIEFSQLLFKENYQKLISEDYPHLYYNVICTDNPQKTLMPFGISTIEVTFRCDSPYAWSHQSVETFKIENTIPYTFQIENKSNVVQYVYPTIELYSLSDNNTITVKNLSDNKQFTIKNVEKDELITIDNEFSILTTTVPNVYRYNDFDGKWIRLVMGNNVIEVTGKCIVTFKNNFPIAI